MAAGLSVDRTIEPEKIIIIKNVISGMLTKHFVLILYEFNCIHVNLLPKKIWRNFLETWLKNWRILSVFDIPKMWVNNAKITHHVQRDVHLQMFKSDNQEK